MEKYFQRLIEKKEFNRKSFFLYFAFLILFFIFPGQVTADITSASASVKSFEPPSDFTATVINIDRIDLKWSSVSNAVSYKVYRDSSLITSPTTTSYSDTGLSQGTSYSYTVSSVNVFGGESEQSSSISATTLIRAGSVILPVASSPSLLPPTPPSPPPSPLSPEAQKIDIKKDDKIDLLDFNILMANWGATEAGNIADFNDDSRVDIFDFNLLMIYWTL